jgi:hypothetical protein
LLKRRHGTLPHRDSPLPQRSLSRLGFQPRDQRRTFVQAIHPPKPLANAVQEIITSDKQSQPKKLLPLGCQIWINSKPLTMDDFQGKLVLLCLGMSSRSLKICEIAHKLYADRGLCVVGIASPPVSIPPFSMEASLDKLGIPFPFGVGDGTTMKRYIQVTQIAECTGDAGHRR